MKRSMTGQQKGDLLITEDCSIEVTAWTGLPVVEYIGLFQSRHHHCHFIIK
jgi:hypothetical protein